MARKSRYRRAFKTFNLPNLPPSKLYLKVSALVIPLRNLYLRKGLYDNTYIVITYVVRRYTKACILSRTFNG